jgi:hypothetical protein
MKNITKSELKAILCKTFIVDDYLKDDITFELGGSGDNWIIKYGCPYSAPEFNTEKLMQLCEKLGTFKININNYDEQGCETCDYGSDYGYTFSIPKTELLIKGV